MGCDISSKLFLVSVICGLFVAVAVADDEYEGLYSLSVEHSFDSGLNAVFAQRGTVKIQSVRSGLVEFSPQSALSEEDKSKLRDLAMSDGFYRIRVRKNSDVDSAANYVYSFMKACALYESCLSDRLTLHIDQSGNLISASISPTLPYCSGDEVTRQCLSNFNTTVVVQQTANGPAPETQAYIQKMEQEKIEKAKGQQADNRGFFAKYWMYIIPFVIFFMMKTGGDANGGGGGR